MKVVIAPDKFKGCLSAIEVARAIARGARRSGAGVEVDCCPMADGGEGTVQALVEASGGSTQNVTVTGPLPTMKVDAPVGFLGDDPSTAVVEMSSASGLYLLSSSQRDPTRTTTYGTGELLRAACELGARRIILGLGGSATIDGGVGCAQAWGVRFSLSSGHVFSADDRKLTGGDLVRLRNIEPARRAQGNELAHRRWSQRAALVARGKTTRALPAKAERGMISNPEGVEFLVACDVGNTLLGENGAAAIFGPQKGADEDQVGHLELGLATLVQRMGRHDLADKPGAGAAGGLGFGMMAFFGAKLRPGIDIVIDATRLRERLIGSDLCITGEGRLDAQSLAGKTTIGVARICKEMNVPCIAITGSIGLGAEEAISKGMTSYFSICPYPMSMKESVENAPDLIADCTANVLRTWRRAADSW